MHPNSIHLLFLPLPPHLPLTSLFILVAMEASVCPIVYLLVLSVSLSNVNESQVWFKAYGFLYTIITGS